MQRLGAISTLLASLLTIPLYAQHGGGGHFGGGGFAGHAGGFRAAPSSPASHPGFAGVRSGGLQPRPGIAPQGFRRPPLQGPGMQTSVAGRPSNGTAFRQPYRSPNSPDRARWQHGGIIYENLRGRRGGYRTGYILPYFWGYPSFGLGYYGGYGYDDSLNYDSSQSYGQGYDPQYDQGQVYGPDQYNGFDPQGPDPDQDPNRGQMQYKVYGQDLPNQDDSGQRAFDQDLPNQIPPGTAYQPNYGSPAPPRPSARPTYHSSSPAKDQPAITLVFNDHRPNQVIHNYLINGGILTVWDQRAHDIPVADINIDATRKLNREQGLDFLLPARSN